MNKNSKKRVAILNKRVVTLQRALAGAKSQTDEPDEIEKIEKDLREVKAEIERLVES